MSRIGRSLFLLVCNRDSQHGVHASLGGGGGLENLGGSCAGHVPFGSLYSRALILKKNIYVENNVTFTKSVENHYTMAS